MKKVIGLFSVVLLSAWILSACGANAKTADDMSDDVIDQVGSPRVEQTSADQGWSYNLLHLSFTDDDSAFYTR